jgi:hypothetical protein
MYDCKYDEKQCLNLMDQKKNFMRILRKEEHVVGLSEAVPRLAIGGNSCQNIGFGMSPYWLGYHASRIGFAVPFGEYISRRGYSPLGSPGSEF